MLANEFQLLCKLGRNKHWRAGRPFLPLHLGRRFRGQSLCRQGGGRGRWRETAHICAKCRQPAGIAASSSWEQHLVLALVLFLLCEELQSCFFSECIRKAVNSRSRAVPWQALQAQSHKCFGLLQCPHQAGHPCTPQEVTYAAPGWLTGTVTLIHS